MAFTLDHVVPWGRNLHEYRQMFQLDDTCRLKKIADFGGGPSSFNCEANRLGYSVTSFDPIYQLIRNVIDYFQKDFDVEIRQTEYEFQKGGNKLLVIKK